MTRCHVEKRNLLDINLSGGSDLSDCGFFLKRCTWWWWWWQYVDPSCKGMLMVLNCWYLDRVVVLAKVSIHFPRRIFISMLHVLPVSSGVALSPLQHLYPYPLCVNGYVIFAFFGGLLLLLFVLFWPLYLTEGSARNDCFYLFLLAFSCWDGVARTQEVSLPARWYLHPGEKLW